MNDQTIAEFMRKMYGYGAKHTLRTIETVLQKAKASGPRPPKPLYIGRIEQHVADSTFAPEAGSALDQRNKKAGVIPAKHRQEHIDLMEGKLNGQDVSIFAAGQHKSASGERPYIDPKHSAHVTADAGPRGYLMYHPDTAATQHAGTKPSELWRHGVRTTSPSGQSPVFSGKSAGRDDSEQSALENKTRKRIYEILNRGVDNGWSHDHAGLLPIDYDPTNPNAATDKAAATIASKAHFDAHIAKVESATPPEIVEPDVKPVVAHQEEKKKPDVQPARARGTGIVLGGSSELAVVPQSNAKDGLSGAKTAQQVAEDRENQALKDFRKTHCTGGFPVTEAAITSWIKEKRLKHESSPRNKNTPFDPQDFRKKLERFTPIFLRQQRKKEANEVQRSERHAGKEAAVAAATAAGLPLSIPINRASTFGAKRNRLDIAIDFAGQPNKKNGKPDLVLGPWETTKALFYKLPVATQRRHLASADKAIRLDMAIGLANLPNRTLEHFRQLPVAIQKRHLASADAKLAAQAKTKEELLAQNARGQARSRRGEAPEKRKALARAARVLREAPGRERDRIGRSLSEGKKQSRGRRRPYTELARLQSLRQNGMRHPSLMEYDDKEHEKEYKEAFDEETFGEHEKIPALAQYTGRYAYKRLTEYKRLLTNPQQSDLALSPKEALILAQYEALHDRHRIANLSNRTREIPIVRDYYEELKAWHAQVLHANKNKRDIPPPPFMEGRDSTRLNPRLRSIVRDE